MKRIVMVVVLLTCCLAHAGDLDGSNFKVSIQVIAFGYGDASDYSVNTLEKKILSDLRKNLRSLGDVDVLEKNGKWNHFISIMLIEEMNAVAIGISTTRQFDFRWFIDYVMTDCSGQLADSILSNFEDILIYDQFQIGGVAVTGVDGISQWAADYVSEFDVETLEPIRQLRIKLDEDGWK